MYEKLLPYLKKNYIVISDRYADSSIAYQSAGRKLNIDLVNKLNKLALDQVKPDITFLLDNKLETSLKKAKSLSKEYKGGDRIEQESINFHKKVKNEYEKLLKKNKHRMFKVTLKNNISETQGIIREITLKKIKEDQCKS